MLSSRVPSDSSQSTTQEGMVPVRQLSQMVSGIYNDLKSLKQYLETTDTTVADNAAVEYAYNVSPQIYRQDPDGSIRQVNPDSSLSSLGISSETSSNNIMSSMMNTSVFWNCPRPRSCMHPSTTSRPAAGRERTTNACWCWTPPAA